VWADLSRPGSGDGIRLDAEGAIWTPVRDKACVRVREGGELLQRIELDRFCYACMLGGTDRATLFMLAADWRGVEHVDEVVASRTGVVLTACSVAL
jgi:sugar lactone lactonase YvrE